MEAINPNILQKVMQSINKKPRNTKSVLEDEVIDYVNENEDYNKLLLTHERSLKQEYVDKIVHIHDEASKSKKYAKNNPHDNYVNPLLLKIKNISHDISKFLNKFAPEDYEPKTAVSKNIKSLLESTTTLTSESIKTQLMKSPSGREFYTKKAMADVISNKVIKYSTIAFNLSKKLSAAGIDGVTWMLGTSWKILKSLFSNFVNKPVTMILSGVDYLLGKIFGVFWEKIKKITSNVVIKPVTWFIKLGFTAMEYIWTGIKTIFSLGMDVIYKVVDIVGYGLKKLFKFSVKLITNTIMTLFNPLTWLALIPILLIGGEVLMDVISAGILTAGFIGEIAIEGIKIVAKIATLIWNGISSFFGAVTLDSGFVSWAGKVFDFIASSIHSVLVMIFGKDKVNNFFGIVNKVLTYFVDLGKTGIGHIKNMIDGAISIFDEISSTPGGLTVWALDEISKYEVGANIPGNIILNGYLKGIVGKVHSMLGQKYTPNVRELDLVIRNQKSSLITDMLQNYYVSMSKEGLSESDIKDKLVKDIIPLLTTTYKVSPESFNANTAIKNAKNYLSTGKRAVTQDVISSSMKIINDAEAVKQLIISGKLDINADVTNNAIERIKKFQSENIGYNSYVFSNVNKGIETSVDQLNTYNKQFNLRVNEHKLETYKRVNAIEQSKLSTLSDALNGTSKIASDVLILAVSGIFKGVPDDVRSKAGGRLTNFSSSYAVRETLGQDVLDVMPGTKINNVPIAKIPTAPSITVPPKKMADGAVIDRNDIIMKLDNDSINYVRSQIKQLDIEPEEDVVTHITNVHKTSSVIMQTHQLYTLKQLSRGILV